MRRFCPRGDTVTISLAKRFWPSDGVSKSIQCRHDLARFGAEAEQLAADVRTAMSGDATADPSELFAHVYARPTPALAAQREFLLAELADSSEGRTA